METETGKISKSDLPEEVVEYIEALETTLTKQEDRIVKLTGEEEHDEEDLDDEEDEDEDEDDVEKSLEAAISKADPTIRSIILKQQKELEETREILEKDREERRRQEFISKAESLPNIVGEVDEIASVLEDIDSYDSELADEVAKMLAVANNQIEKSSSGLYNSIGSDGADFTMSSSIESAAAAIQKGDPTLTREQAVVLAYEQNPDLYIEEINDKEGSR